MTKVKPQNSTVKELVTEQIKLQETIQRRANINVVNCGQCGSVFFHKKKRIDAKNQDLTCPYCKFTSDPCDFPDFIYEGIQENEEFNQ